MENISSALKQIGEKAAPDIVRAFLSGNVTKDEVHIAGVRNALSQELAKLGEVAALEEDLGNELIPQAKERIRNKMILVLRGIAVELEKKGFGWMIDASKSMDTDIQKRMKSKTLEVFAGAGKLLGLKIEVHDLLWEMIQVTTKSNTQRMAQAAQMPEEMTRGAGWFSPPDARITSSL